MLGILSGKSPEVHAKDDYMGWEFVGRRAIRQGDWKLHWRSNAAGGRWQLFNLRHDPGEKADLIDQEQEIATRLVTLWERYSRETGVVLPDKKSVY